MNESAEDDEELIPTVADAVAVAEAWNERAAILSTMAFELRTVFGPLHGNGPPPYLIRRIGGGASPASLAAIEDVRTELFMAAGQARDEARKILASATHARADGHAPGIAGGGVAPSAEHGSIKIPTGGDEVVANADCPRAHQKLGDGPKILGDAEEERPAEQGRVLRAVELPRAGSREARDRQTENIRPLRPKARTR